MSEKRTEMQVMTELMQALNAMTDASGQMIHQRGNIKWMAIRDYLNIIRDIFTKKIAGQFKK